MDCKTGFEVFGVIAVLVAFGFAFGWHTEIITTGDLKAQLDDANLTIASLNSDLNITREDLIPLIDMFELEETDSSDYWRKGSLWITKQGNYTCVLQNVDGQVVQAGISSTNNGEIVIEVRKFNETSGCLVWNCTGEECLEKK